jgi:hypothetical protein
VATGLCLIAPVIMGAQEWNDHDRSEKVLAPDLARDYLNSCPPNAILFTFGDNDTYPLWYAQEVEGVRPDIRIVNTSLLGIDWYVNQLRYKVNQSAPFDIIWNAEQIRGLPYIRIETNPALGPTNLYDFMKNRVGPLLNTDMEQKSTLSVQFPASLTVPVDPATAKASGAATVGDSVTTQMQLDIPSGKNFLSLDQLTMLNILASNQWKRPICFTSPYNEIGFAPFLRQEGMVFRLTPVRQAQQRSMDVNKTDSLLRNVFRYGGANNPGVYFDEENRRHLLTIRQTYALAASGLADEGRKPEAVSLLEKVEKGISTQSLPYAMVSRFQSHNQIGILYLESAYKAGHTTLANKVKEALKKDLTDQKNYYNYLKNSKTDFYPSFANDEEDCNRFLGYIDNMEKAFNPQSTIIKENPGRRDTTDSAK